MSNLPRDQPGWYNASQWLAERTIAVHGFGSDFRSSKRAVTEEDIRAVFNPYGHILHTQIWTTQKGGAWAFVTYGSTESRGDAIRGLNHQTVDMWAREGDRQIDWKTPLRVTEPRFHSVRFYYDQYAAAKMVPPELMDFTPSAEPGEGGTYQRSARPKQSPTSPRHGRSLTNRISIDTSFHNSHERSPSPAPSHGTSIQWGHERPETPEPSSAYYDSEMTCYSPQAVITPGDDDGEEIQEYDYGYNHQDLGHTSSSTHISNHAGSSNTPSLIPPSSYDDHDESSVYPQSSPEPSSSRKRRRVDDDYEDDEVDGLQTQIRKLREDNDNLRATVRDLQYEVDTLRKTGETRARNFEAERAEYTRQITRLSDNLCTQLESTRDQRPFKRSRFSLPPPELQTAAQPASVAGNLIHFLQNNPAVAAIFAQVLDSTTQYTT